MLPLLLDTTSPTNEQSFVMQFFSEKDNTLAYYSSCGNESNVVMSLPCNLRKGWKGTGTFILFSKTETSSLRPPHMDLKKWFWWSGRFILLRFLRRCSGNGVHGHIIPTSLQLIRLIKLLHRNSFFSSAVTHSSPFRPHSPTWQEHVQFVFLSKFS